MMSYRPTPTEKDIERTERIKKLPIPPPPSRTDEDKLETINSHRRRVGLPPLLRMP